MEPFGTPFGWTFVFQDPDGYAVPITAPTADPSSLRKHLYRPLGR
jgi:hypothetical protein